MDVLFYMVCEKGVLEMDPVEFITTDELKQQLDAGEKFELVDVREDEEVAEGMIPGAKTYPDDGNSGES